MPLPRNRRPRNPLTDSHLLYTSTFMELLAEYDPERRAVLRARLEVQRALVHLEPVKPAEGNGGAPGRWPPSRALEATHGMVARLHEHIQYLAGE